MIFFKVSCYRKHLKVKKRFKLEFWSKYKPERNKSPIISTRVPMPIWGSVEVAGLAFTGFKFTLEVLWNVESRIPPKIGIFNAILAAF